MTKQNFEKQIARRDKKIKTLQKELTKKDLMIHHYNTYGAYGWYMSYLQDTVSKLEKECDARQDIINTLSRLKMPDVV